MDSTPVIKTDGKTDASVTDLRHALDIAKIEQYEEAKRIKKNDVARLRNYLFKQFELYMTMGIDRHIKFNNVNVRYNAKEKFFELNNGQIFRSITKLAWNLRTHYAIQSPNKKNEWINISDLKS